MVIIMRVTRMEFQKQGKVTSDVDQQVILIVDQMRNGHHLKKDKKSVKKHKIEVTRMLIVAIIAIRKK